MCSTADTWKTVSIEFTEELNKIGFHDSQGLSFSDLLTKIKASPDTKKSPNTRHRNMSIKEKVFTRNNPRFIPFYRKTT